jgi:hypothetical protein
MSNGPLSMCDIVASLRLINLNLEYLETLPYDQLTRDMKTHLSQDKEYIIAQARHNIDTRNGKNNIELEQTSE